MIARIAPVAVAPTPGAAASRSVFVTCGRTTARRPHHPVAPRSSEMRPLALRPM